MNYPARLSAVTASALLLLAASGLSAQVAHQGNSLSALAFSDARFRPAPAIVPFDEATQTSLTSDIRAGWADFSAMSPVRWQAYVDRRTGHLESAVGGGIAWLPGRGNSLKASEANLATLEATARAALPRIVRMLGVDGNSLVLNPGRSGRQSDNLWYVDFDVRLAGMTVEGARVVFRVSHGNLVEIGGERLPSPAALIPTAKIGREQALAALADYVHGFSAGDVFSDSGSLHLLPVELSDSRFTGGFEPGNGRGLALVWEIVFHRSGVTGTWRARIDAESGRVRVLELLDMNLNARVTGGVFPQSRATTPETVLPMPFADVFSNQVGLQSDLRFVYTDSNGFFALPNWPPPYRSSLSGKYVFIHDECPQPSASSDFANNISFGTSSGTDDDCELSVGQYRTDGSTHSARTQFYHVNRIKEVARGWLPGNAWLANDLLVNVNVTDTSLIGNARWDGTELNFGRKGTDDDGRLCNNSGEISGISMHEFGHGLDQNDGNGKSPDGGTQETYADFTSTLMTHISCVGPGLYVNGACDGDGDSCTSCTGVRDLDFSKHASGVPATVSSFTQPFCEDPDPTEIPGACGLDPHCESYVSSEALWDFVARDLSNPGGAAAWAIAERLWYLSRATATGAFTCDTAPAVWTSSGCATGSLWRTLRAADDDDGNLANGTPHSCQLFAAFNRHGIACPTDPGANVCFTSYTPPLVPTLSLTTTSPGQVQVSWTNSGGGVLYDVYRSELGCNSGFVLIASNVATSPYIDTSVSSGFTYSYQVVAHLAGCTGCAAAPTSCQSVVPLAPPACSPPVAPTGLAVTDFSISTILLSWPAVGGIEGYNVYRAATPGGPYTLVGAVPAPDTDFGDPQVSGNTSYFYKIRSYVNGCESADSNVAMATTATCKPVTLYKTDFETGGGLAGWTVQNLAGGSAGNDWRGVQACFPARSGSQIFRFGGSTCGGAYGTSEAASAAPPAVFVPAGALNTKMSFWHRRDFKTNFDGGMVRVALDGGAPIGIPRWNLSGDNYDNNIAGGLGQVSGGACPPDGFGGPSVFSGTKSTMVNTVALLDETCRNALGGSGCGGHSIQPGFLAISDCVQGGNTGWFLDDIEITTCVPESPMGFYTLTPCRLIDTRNAAGPLGGPALPAGASRTFTVAGACQIPSSAQALSINLTVVAAGSAGFLQVYPGGSSTPAVSAINFAQGQTRANNGLVTLAFDGTGTITVRSGASGPVNFVIDVSGYYQ